MNATLSFTNAELFNFRACGREERIATLSAHLGRTPENDEPVALSVWAEVTPGVADLLWALRCCWDQGGREVGVEVVCRAAERAMIHARPDDVPVLRTAVDAARGCVTGTVTREDCISAGHAAYAAFRDAYAKADRRAEAARAAANAAYAAAHVTDDAAHVIHAANAAANACHASSVTERDAQRSDLLALAATAS